MRDSLDGSVAVVTGASAGIGEATAFALAEAGAAVTIAARRTDRLEALAERIEESTDGTARVSSVDVSDADDVANMITDTVETFGQLDIVVNNAGIGGPGDIDACTIDAYRRLMGVNVDGMFYVTKASVPHLRETKGNLIYVASFAGCYPRPGNAVYAASKWWTRGFAHSLAGTLGPEGIGVTVINPTEVRTEIGEGDAPPMKERYAPGDVTEPQTIAAAILFAARQDPQDTVHELDLYRRDKFEPF